LEGDAVTGQELGVCLLVDYPLAFS
jgi:hypothetical protein